MGCRPHRAWQVRVHPNAESRVELLTCRVFAVRKLGTRTGPVSLWLSCCRVSRRLTYRLLLELRARYLRLG
jgi:hypothetical protein